jgi:hypothetical protein
MFKYLRRRATMAGPLGGSRGWTLVWAVLLGARFLKRLRTPKPQILLTQEIKPGEAFLISGVDREPRIIGGTAR